MITTFDPVHQLTGENPRIYRLGDSIAITVARVDLDERKIDFVLAQTEEVYWQATRQKRQKTCPQSHPNPPVNRKRNANG